MQLISINMPWVVGRVIVHPQADSLLTAQLSPSWLHWHRWGKAVTPPITYLSIGSPVTKHVPYMLKEKKLASPKP